MGISKCGILLQEGKLKLSSKSKILTLYVNPGSESELPIYFKEQDQKQFDDYLNGHVRALVKIEKKCRFFCHGKLERIIGHLDPLKRPKNLTDPNIIMKEQTECL